MGKIYLALGMLVFGIGGLILMTIIGFLPGFFIAALGWWLIVIGLFRTFNPEYKAEIEAKREARRDRWKDSASTTRERPKLIGEAPIPKARGEARPPGKIAREGPGQQWYGGE